MQWPTWVGSCGWSPAPNGGALFEVPNLFLRRALFLSPQNHLLARACAGGHTAGMTLSSVPQTTRPRKGQACRAVQALLRRCPAIGADGSRHRHGPPFLRHPQAPAVPDAVSRGLARGSGCGPAPSAGRPRPARSMPGRSAAEERLAADHGRCGGPRGCPNRVSAAQGGAEHNICSQGLERLERRQGRPRRCEVGRRGSMMKPVGWAGRREAAARPIR